MKQGKKRQTGTHENELVHMSASSFNNADDIGDFYHEVAYQCTLAKSQRSRQKRSDTS